MVAMVTILFTVYCKLFHMMPYIIILKVRKFHQTTASRFSTARKKPVGGAHCAPPPSLNRVKDFPVFFGVLFMNIASFVCENKDVGRRIDLFHIFF